MIFPLFSMSLIGYIGDSIIAWKSDLIYSRSFDFFAPLWLLVMWFSFSSTLIFSIKWVFNKLWITIVIGLFFAPMSYVAGIHLSGSYFIAQNNYLFHYLIEGIWLVVLLTCYRKLNEIYGWYDERSESR